MAKQTSKQTSKQSSKPISKSTGKQVAKKTSGAPKQFFLIRWSKNAVNYIVASYGELKKVSWPTRKELTKSTGIVILLIAVFTVVIFSFDTIFSFLTNLLYDLV